MKPAKVFIGSTLILTVQDDDGNLPNWVSKLVRLHACGLIKMKAGQLTHIDVRHDKGCRVYKDGMCKCDPEIVQK